MVNVTEKIATIEKTVASSGSFFNYLAKKPVYRSIIDTLIQFYPVIPSLTHFAATTTNIGHPQKHVTHSSAKRVHF